MKWIMCMMAVGGPHDGEINCKVKDIPEDYREQIDASFEFFKESVEGLIVSEEFDPNKDYGGVIHFEEDSEDTTWTDVIELLLQLQADENGRLPGDTLVNVKEAKKE